MGQPISLEALSRRQVQALTSNSDNSQHCLTTLSYLTLSVALKLLKATTLKHRRWSKVQGHIAFKEQGRLPIQGDTLLPCLYPQHPQKQSRALHKSKTRCSGLKCLEAASASPPCPGVWPRGSGQMQAALGWGFGPLGESCLPIGLCRVAMRFPFLSMSNTDLVPAALNTVFLCFCPSSSL